VKGAGLVLVAWLAGACATGRVRPDIHKEGWLLVETEHIALRTDLPREEARWRAKGLEQYWQVLAASYAFVVPHAAPPRGPFAVIQFGRCEDYRLVGRSGGGFAITMMTTMERVAVSCEGEGDPTFIHELAHIFNGHFFASLPLWVEEGLADYYGALAVRKGEVVLGRVPMKFRAEWRLPTRAPHLADVRRMGSEQFHSAAGGFFHYFAAWRLVHFLNHTSADLRLRFRRYLLGMGAGLESNEAWNRAFGDVPADRLDALYRAHLALPEVNVWKAAYAVSEPPAPRVRPLRAGESHILWALLLATSDTAEAARQLDRAADIDPGDPEILYWRAVVVRPPDAVQLLRAYVARRPRDPRGWHALVWLQLDRLVPSSQVALGGEPPAGIESIDADVRRLVGRASTPESLDTIARYFALRRNPVTGLNFGLRAVAARPGCASCWDTVGLLLFEAGRRERAIAAQERAVALYAEHAPPGALARLRQYRAARVSRRTPAR
jgi:tetratricopeptide (TPR) repeat protein